MAVLAFSEDMLTLKGDFEVIKVTKMKDNILTIERGQNGTTPMAFCPGAFIKQATYTADTENTDDTPEPKEAEGIKALRQAGYNDRPLTIRAGVSSQPTIGEQVITSGGQKVYNVRGKNLLSISGSTSGTRPSGQNTSTQSATLHDGRLDLNTATDYNSWITCNFPSGDVPTLGTTNPSFILPSGSYTISAKALNSATESTLFPTGQASIVAQCYKVGGNAVYSTRKDLGLVGDRPATTLDVPDGEYLGNFAITCNKLNVRASWLVQIEPGKTATAWEKPTCTTHAIDLSGYDFVGVGSSLDEISRYGGKYYLNKSTATVKYADISYEDWQKDPDQAGVASGRIRWRATLHDFPLLSADGKYPVVYQLKDDDKLAKTSTDKDPVSVVAKSDVAYATITLPNTIATDVDSLAEWLSTHDVIAYVGMPTTVQSTEITNPDVVAELERLFDRVNQPSTILTQVNQAGYLDGVIITK